VSKKRRIDLAIHVLNECSHERFQFIQTIDDDRVLVDFSALLSTCLS